MPFQADLRRDLKSKKIPRFTTVIFDLDGTIVDSASSILQTIQMATLRMGLIIEAHLDDSLIGPPLEQILRKITCIDDPILINNLLITFKEIYDSVGYKKSTPYDGVEHLLANLKKSGVILILATNKRMIPTIKILEHFRLQQYFESIYTIDMNNYAHYSSKSTMLSSLIFEMGVEPQFTLYVGDRLEDQIAAEENKLTSATVAWGYDDYEYPKRYSKMLMNPTQLACFILAKE
jgi:phosphoglycolate phosphatase